MDSEKSSLKLRPVVISKEEKQRLVGEIFRMFRLTMTYVREGRPARTWVSG